MQRILIVDDDTDILEIIQLELEDDPDNTIDACSSSTKALDFVHDNRYDVIITDWRMPDLNGTELVRTLRENGCKSAIVIYSGKGMDQDIREALDCGADHYLNRRGYPEKEFAELKKIIKGSGGTGAISDMKKPAPG
jgi:DNA-binding response OmpR family regulator